MSTIAIPARPPEPTELPGRLQATFVPTEAAIAWWGVPQLDDALRGLGLPAGRPGTFRIAVPSRGRVTPASVPVRFIDLDPALAALRAIAPRDDVGASVRAWHDLARLRDRGDEAFEELSARMPPAAHAVLNADETAITTATALVARFRLVAGTRDALRATRVEAELRPYQVNGVAWLRARLELGRGGVLADEMGLGKTLQAICLLATRQSAHPHLVVCPTSLIGNWRRELARFSPATPVIGYHGARRTIPESVPGGTVVVTSYSVLRQDATLRATAWDVVVLDEAQQIKNPDALVTKAAAALSATFRIAMTGSPVENRLEELWSLLNVTNPGVLGSRARFRQRFVVPIEQRRSSSAAAALNTLTEPHLLRRTKSDVAADLPPKQYSTIICTLTEEQARLYREAVDQAFSRSLGSGIERRGRVLGLITSLKQICNHPAQYLGGEVGEPGRSGKFDRTAEMLAEIVDDGDRALVFTQYRAMGELLSRSLADVVGTGSIPFLHGGLSAERRDRLVQAFQDDDQAPPILLLSLRAAGFGLNLTRAAHVLHYDRWWNPAVEEQATDRAHRIGQRRTLNVHTLVTGGTIEDHIARLHDAKRGLAAAVSGDTAAALAELSDDTAAALAELSDDGLRAVLDLDPGVVS